MQSGKHGHRRMRHSFGLPALVAGCFAVAFLVTVAARAAASEPAATPQDAASGFVIVGPVDMAWGSSTGVTVGAAAIANNSSHTGNLSLHLWATPMISGPPTVNQLLNFQDLGGISLGTLKAGAQLTNVSHQGLAFTEPQPKGCYYVELALLNETVLVDIFANSRGGTPTTSGYDLYAFGNGVTCPPATSCAPGSLNGCLNTGRFQVTAAYYNASGGKAQGQVLSFNGARAESDESVFYYFTDPSNFEMGVKVLDACALNNFFWVFIGGLTNQGWEVNVLDTKTGNVKNYNNDLGTTTVTTTDTAALPCP